MSKRPSSAAILERDQRVRAELACGANLDPNVALLGDPSPQRRAVTERIGADPIRSNRGRDRDEGVYDWQNGGKMWVPSRPPTGRLEN
jgi:hypothetical protein